MVVWAAPLNSGQVQRAKRQRARLACRKARGLTAGIGRLQPGSLLITVSP